MYNRNYDSGIDTYNSDGELISPHRRFGMPDQHRFGHGYEEHEGDPYGRPFNPPVPGFNPPEYRQSMHKPQSPNMNPMADQQLHDLVSRQKEEVRQFAQFTQDLKASLEELVAAFRQQSQPVPQQTAEQEPAPTEEEPTIKTLLEEIRSLKEDMAKAVQKPAQVVHFPIPPSTVGRPQNLNQLEPSQNHQVQLPYTAPAHPYGQAPQQPAFNPSMQTSVQVPHLTWGQGQVSNNGLTTAVDTSGLGFNTLLMMVSILDYEVKRDGFNFTLVFDHGVRVELRPDSIGYSRLCIKHAFGSFECLVQQTGAVNAFMTHLANEPTKPAQPKVNEALVEAAKAAQALNLVTEDHEGDVTDMMTKIEPGGLAHLAEEVRLLGKDVELDGPIMVDLTTRFHDKVIELVEEIQVSYPGVSELFQGNNGLTLALGAGDYLSADFNVDAVDVEQGLPESFKVMFNYWLGERKATIFFQLDDREMFSRARAFWLEQLKLLKSIEQTTFK